MRNSWFNCDKYIIIIFAASFIIAKIRRQPKGPQIEEWTKKWCIYSPDPCAHTHTQWNVMEYIFHNIIIFHNIT